jgi:tetratricopeptide (TPR) repeat protein
MKILFLLFFIVSCSSSRIERKIEDVSWDTLADETYLRWGEKRLAKHANPNHKVVQCHQGEIRQTLNQFRTSYTSKENDQYYWLHLGNCYFLKDSWIKAEFYYRLFLDEIKTQTMKSVALNNLGLIYLKYEQWEKAKDYLIQSSVLAPRFKVPKFNLAQLYLQFGHHDKTIEILTGNTFKSDKDIDVYFTLANAYLFKGDIAKTKYYFSLIPSEHFSREDIAATYALFLMKLGYNKEAFSIMGRRVRSNVLEVTAISQKIEKVLLQRMKEE